MPTTETPPLYVKLLPGIRQDVDPRTAEPGTLTRAENVRFGRMGGIYPRPGTVSIAADTDTPASHAIANSTEGVGFMGKVGSVGLLGTQGKVFARDSIFNGFHYQGDYSTALPLGRINTSIVEGGAAALSGVGVTRNATATNPAGDILIAASDGTNVRYEVFISGVRANFGITAGTKCSVLPMANNTFVLVVQNATNLSATVVTPGASVAFGTTTSITTLTSAAAFWDVAAATNGTDWYLVAQVSATLLGISRHAGVSTIAATSASVLTGTCPLSVYQDASGLWVGYVNDPSVSGNVRYLVRNASSLAAVAGPFTIVSGVALYGPPLFGTYPSNLSPSTAFYVVRGLSASTQIPYRALYGSATTAGTIVGPFNAWHVRPISKPDSRLRVWCITQNYGAGSTPTEYRMVLLRFPIQASTGIGQGLVASIELAGPLFRGGSSFPDNPATSAEIDYFSSATQSTDGRYVFSVPRVYRIGSSASTNLLGLDTYAYSDSILHPQRKTVEFGAALVVAGQPVEVPANGTSTIRQTTTLLDGLEVGSIEIGFPYRPTIFSLAQSQVGGTRLTLLGVYNYVAIFEQIDSLGRRSLSPPSDPVSFTLTGSNDTITVTMSTLGYSQRYNSNTQHYVVAHVYRTTAGGVNYQRVTPGNGAPLAIDASDGSITYVDTMPDATLLTQEFAYFEGEKKENSLAPSCRTVFRAGSRLACGLGWEPDITTLSKEWLSPNLPPEFTDSDAFRIKWDEPLVANGYLDGAIIGFSANNIYATFGDGPNDQGVGSYAPPRPIATGIGATSDVILNTSLGLMFFNSRGWWILPPGPGAPIYVGAHIQRETESFSVPLASASLYAERSRGAMLLMANSDGTEQSTYVMDLDVRAADGLPAWAKDTIDRDVSTIGEWPGGVAYGLEDLSNDDECGAVLDGSFFGDMSDAAIVSEVIETADIRPFGQVGWGDIASATLFMSDSDDAPVTARAFVDDAEKDVASWTPVTTSGSLYHQLSWSDRQGTSCYFRVSVNRDATHGPAFHGIQIDIIPQAPTRLLSQAER